MSTTVKCTVACTKELNGSLVKKTTKISRVHAYIGNLIKMGENFWQVISIN